MPPCACGACAHHRETRWHGRRPALPPTVHRPAQNGRVHAHAVGTDAAGGQKQGVKKIFHGVAQRPGKPFWFGLSSRATPVFALPGNPVSSYTCLHRYVLPALAQASGATPVAQRMVALAEPLVFPPKLAYLLPVTLSSGPRAELIAKPERVNTSGDFAGLIDTDGFIELPADKTEFPAGTIVPFTPWG